LFLSYLLSASFNSSNRGLDKALRALGRFKVTGRPLVDNSDNSQPIGGHYQ
jgi:hypothetical protein